MGEGLHFATLVTLMGKRYAVRYGKSRVTIGAVGYKDGARFVMGTFSDGSTVLGEPYDFTIPSKVRGGVRAGEQRLAPRRENGHRRDNTGEV